MAFRSSATPSEGLREAKALAKAIKQFCVYQTAQLENTTQRNVVLQVCTQLRKYYVDLTAISMIPGIAAYAASQENDASYNIAAEFNAMLSAIEAAIQQITSTFPRAQSGEILEKTLAVDGQITIATFSGAQLATLRTRLSALAAVIE